MECAEDGFFGPVRSAFEQAADFREIAVVDGYDGCGITHRPEDERAALTCAFEQLAIAGLALMSKRARKRSDCDANAKDAVTQSNVVFR